jgi:6-phosphogluconolactonase
MEGRAMTGLKKTLVYIGTYTETIRFGTGEIFSGKGEGIHIFDLDPDAGVLQPRHTAKGIKNPSYLAFHPSGRFLYAVNELKEHEGHATGTLSAFAVEDGLLRFINKVPTHGTDPCHVAVDRTGGHALAANYSSGSIAVFPIREDGGLGEASRVVQHEGSGADPVRQSGPHAHSVNLDASNRFLYVPDLGLDRLMIYRFDAHRGELEPHEQPWLETAPGAGPRHLAFHPAGRFAYLINELDSTILALRFDGEKGTVEAIQTVPTIPESFRGRNISADVHVHPSGKFLYGSNRGHDSIAVYRIDGQTGRLTFIGHQSTGGKAPRNFALDPGGQLLLAANQDSDTVTAFRVDGDSGRLDPGESTEAPTPVCVKILRL